MNTQVSGSYRRPIYYDACSAVLQIAIMLTNKLGKELDCVVARSTNYSPSTKLHYQGQSQPASNLL